MYCHIAKDKTTGEQFLIPGCWSVLNMWESTDDDRQLIKDNCTCNRFTREKYETKTRDEVFDIIKKLEEKIEQKQVELSELKDMVEELKTEVFCLNIEIEI